jgi:predicted Na+-dependent transporter
MLQNFKGLVKQHQVSLLIFSVVFLLILLAFALGYLLASAKNKEPLRIYEKDQTALPYRSYS